MLSLVWLNHAHSLDPQYEKEFTIEVLILVRLNQLQIMDQKLPWYWHI